MFHRRHSGAGGGHATAALAVLMAAGGVGGLVSAPDVAASVPANAGVATHAPAQVKPLAAATLEGCQTAAVQAERSATFVGEMTAVPGTSRMLMRIDILERSGAETSFRTVAYPGLNDWLRAAPGVKTYKNLDRVTDLAAPAEYRASIRFRWLGAHGRLLKSSEERTPVCAQSLVVASEEGSSSATPGGTPPAQ